MDHHPRSTSSARDAEGEPPAASDGSLTEAQAARIARSYVAAYNDRDLEAMLALMDEDAVSNPARLFGQRRHRGRADVREWWQTMVDSGRWYQVVVAEIRLLPPDRVAVLGELLDDGEPLSPWGVLVRVRDGLIVESRSYLSEKDLLDELGLLE
jgi:ketosteroid isomerase-like protein